jgi:hypothetical protein
MQTSAIRAALLLLPVSLFGQWLNFKTPGIPRTSDGKPNLTAPAPRTADGKPDLSGLWRPAQNMYWIDISRDPFDESAFTPAAEAVFQKHVGDYGREAPWIHCLPTGPGAIFQSPYRIIQSPSVVAVLQGQGGYRQIFMDGRELPNDPNPTWLGYSVGRWEGDTLVVETAGFNDQSWLDLMGHPHSENLRVTERFRRVDFGHMDFQIAFVDSQTFTKALTVSLPMNYQADTEMLEYVCENERDSPHLARASQNMKFSAATLEKYAGTYNYAGDTPLQPPMRATIAVTGSGGQLYFGPFPLNPQSETKFDSIIGDMTFLMDSVGAVTSFRFTVSPDPCGRGDDPKPLTFVRKR